VSATSSEHETFKPRSPRGGKQDDDEQSGRCGGFSEDKTYTLPKPESDHANVESPYAACPVLFHVMRVLAVAEEVSYACKKPAEKKKNAHGSGCGKKIAYIEEGICNDV
jgi:hypothetical protein